MTSKLTIAVTGANGFLGSHVVAVLLADGHTVRAAVRDPSDTAKTSHLTALPGATSALTLVKGNLSVEGSYDAAFAGADAVVHTAAVVEVLDSKNAEEKILKPSLEGSKN
eukprot:4309190-Prymnesium_polylepis.1